jgi:hypothetical protein
MDGVSRAVGGRGQALAAIGSNEWVAGIAQGFSVADVPVADVRKENVISLDFTIGRPLLIRGE